MRRRARFTSSTLDAGEAAPAAHGERILTSPLPMLASGFRMISNQASWVFVGRIPRDRVINYLECQVQAAGSGAQTAEFAIAVSKNPPNRAAQSLTVLGIASSMTSMVGSAGQVVRNNSAMACRVPGGSYVWAGLRTAFATTQPALFGVAFDYLDGFALQTASAGVLAVGTVYTGAIITPATIAVLAPALRASID